MTADHEIQTPLERIAMQRPAQAYGGGDVVPDIARRELIDEGQSLLRKRERQRPTTSNRFNGHQRSPLPLADLMIDARGERLHRRALKNCSQRQSDVEQVAQT